MTPFQPSRRPLAQTCSRFVLALSATCVLPLAATAVPIQTPPGANTPVTAASASMPGSSGPRRPGQFPTASLGTAEHTAPASGRGRPVPALQETTLTAKE